MYDVIIIGSGCAGYTAAIYTSRAFLKTLIITGPQPGGQLTTTTDVENFPGFPDGIQGPELLQHMKVQAERFGSEITIDSVTNIKFQIPIRQLADKQIPNSKFQTFILEGQEKKYEGRAVIVATGSKSKTVGIPSEEKFRGKGISYCATCDGFFFKGKSVAVLGGGDTAMEEATFLTKFADKVTIIHRRDEFRACPYLSEKARKDPKISFLLNKTVEEFIGDTTLKTIKVKDIDTGTVEELPFDGVFVAVGHIPATEFLKGVVELDNKGYIITKSQIPNPNDQTNRYNTQTSVLGIFAAGDCVDSRYRQAIVAAGMGCQAALDTQKWLEEQE
jgi:thioredoxin reductase (NADPH)